VAKIQRVLISVSDKHGLVDFAQGLAKWGAEFISTGGTAKFLRDAGLTVTEVSAVTGFPEMMGGRVKTLHPKIHGALLALRDDPEHMQQLKQQGMVPIDMVVINLYPFERTISRQEVSFDEALENIDIGGPAMLRSASKNFQDVVVVVNPFDYPDILAEIEFSGGEVSLATRYHLAQRAFKHTAHYDSAITNYFDRWEIKEDKPVPFIAKDSFFPPFLELLMEKAQELRYGENPHQLAAFYQETAQVGPSLARACQLQGKELSFNNFLDLNAAYELAREFKSPAAVIVKHTNPCGVAVAASQREAFLRAKATDPVSAYGGILGFNTPLTGEAAEEVAQTFFEAIIAPGFHAEARQALATKKNLRLMEVTPQDFSGMPQGWDYKRVLGGLLVQERNLKIMDPESLRVATQRAPTPKEMEALRFAWTVVKHIKSNAIVFTTAEHTVGVGAGQMSRVDSVKLCVQKAHLPLKGTVVASDAFFPFRDGVDEAAKAGATAIIQPGGSVRDEEVIKAANEHNMAMVFTGIRHFRH
jgi:phosphoribosylaminoimidazolecarboxamide formyltransferase/IMP cyclohydrolase